MNNFKSQCAAFSRPIDPGQLLRQGTGGRPDQAMDSAWLLSLRVPQAPRSNTDPHVVAECPQPLARLHVPWRKLVWARPDDDFPEAAQANVRNCPVVAADRVPESGRNTSVAPDNVVQQYPSGQHTFPTPPPKAMAHQADFPCALSAVPTANLSRPRSFRSVLNPVPPSQTSPWATSTVRPSRDRCRQSHTPNFSTLSSPACGQSGKPRCSFSCLIAWSRIACTRETASTNCHDLLAWRGQASRDARTVTLVRAQLQHQGRPQR